MAGNVDLIGRSGCYYLATYFIAASWLFVDWKRKIWKITVRVVLSEEIR